MLAESVSPEGDAPPCRDERDRKYLHCAATASVDYLVTYDRDMLDLVHIERIPIVTPGDFLVRLRARNLPLTD